MAEAPGFAHAVYEVTRKEVLQHLRTKRLLILAPIFLAVMVLLTIVFPLLLLDQGNLNELEQASDSGLQNLVLLFFLSGFFFLSGYFYIQLLPIVLTSDSVCSEWSNRTIFLLLSKPVSRTAFVLGKFLGSAITVAGLVLVLLLLDYLVLQFTLPGFSSVEDWGRFAAALGLLVLGAMAYTALALLFSTLTRSAVTANVLAITAWIVVLPLLARLDFFIAVAAHGIEQALADPEASGIGWSQYLSPGDSMRSATTALAGDTQSGGLLASLAGLGSTADPAVGAFALLVQTALFLGLSVLVVQRRNFE
jgi:ABC-type transport system involved in multi-copper enzyme maturation permease subunit